MNEFIGKLIGKLEEKANQTWLVLAERNGYERAIEIVNQLAEEYNNGWIPCSEKLPERTKPFQTNEYTVTMRMITKVGKCSPFSSHASFDYETGKWLVKGFEVIAWQPLPKVYKSKEGES